MTGPGAQVYSPGGDVSWPVVIHRVEPEFTSEASAVRYRGRVFLELIVDEDGFVRKPQVVKGEPYGLDRSAIEAVKQWRFRPGMRHGRPVAVRMHITVTFGWEGQR